MSMKDSLQLYLHISLNQPEQHGRSAKNESNIFFFNIKKPAGGHANIFYVFQFYDGS